MIFSELKMQKNKLTYMNLLALMALTGYLMLEKHCTEEIDTFEFPNPSIIREISPSSEEKSSTNMTRFVYYCHFLV